MSASPERQNNNIKHKPISGLNMSVIADLEGRDTMNKNNTIVEAKKEEDAK